MIFSDKYGKVTFCRMEKVNSRRNVTGSNPLRNNSFDGFFTGQLKVGECMVVWGESLTGYGVRFVQTSPIVSMDFDEQNKVLTVSTENSIYKLTIQDGEVPEQSVKNYQYFLGEEYETGVQD